MNDLLEDEVGTDETVEIVAPEPFPRTELEDTAGIFGPDTLPVSPCDPRRTSG